MPGSGERPTALERVIVVPRNGYVNRIQAWASSAALATDLDVPVLVTWEPEPVAPARFDDLFRPASSGADVLEPEELRSILGRGHEELDRYLSVDAKRRVVTLAGHDRGEQAFMPDLASALGHPCLPTTLVIIAGGKFHMPGSVDVEGRRRRFYRRLEWSPDVVAGVDAAVADRGDFIGLHIRETDRSIAAPTPRAIRSALGALRSRTGIGSVFVAADTPASRQRWLGEAGALGLTGWSAPAPELDRAAVAAAVVAMIDWQILGMSRALVYSRESSFGEEAAVAADAVSASIPLSASTERQRARRAAAVGRSLARYPQRRWSQGRKPS